MRDAILVIQVIISLSLILVISIQTKSGGLGRSWGSSTSFTRRGLERVVFKSTFFLSFLFILISTLALII